MLIFFLDVIDLVGNNLHHGVMVFKCNAGYTLIELVVVTGIIALLVGGGMLSYRTFNQRQLVSQTKENLVTFLNDARKMAEVGETANCDESGLEGMQIVTSENHVRQREVCLNGNGYSITRFDPPTGVTLTPSLDFTFLTLSRGLSPADAVTIAITNGIYSETITISPGGAVN